MILYRQSQFNRDLVQGLEVLTSLDLRHRIPDNVGSIARELSGVMFADLQRDYQSNFFPHPRIGDIDLKVNAGFRIEDWTHADGDAESKKTLGCKCTDAVNPDT